MRDGGLLKLFSKNLSEAHWQSVETGGTGAGVPDAEYCFPGGLQGWIEFKQAKANVVGVRPEQVAWIERRIRYGGQAFLAVRRKHDASARRDARDELFLYRGSEVRALYLGGINKASPIAYGSGGPTKWPWFEVRDLLTRNAI